MTEWSQKALEDIFVRGDVYEVQRAEFEKDLKELSDSLTWATRLVIAQAVVFVGAILVFAVERLAG